MNHTNQEQPVAVSKSKIGGKLAGHGLFKGGGGDAWSNFLKEPEIVPWPPRFCVSLDEEYAPIFKLVGPSGLAKGFKIAMFDDF